MDLNNNENTVEDDLLDEFDILSISFNAIDNKKIVEEIQKLKAELQHIIEIVSKQFGESSIMQKVLQIGEKFDELKNEMDGLKSANRVKIRAFEKLKAQIGRLTEENIGFKEKLAKVEEELAEKNAELEKQKETDKNMVANLTGRVEETELVQMKTNKWNAADCGPKLDIFERGLAVKHLGYGINCIRAISPIPSYDFSATNPSIDGYFEVQIVNKNSNSGYSIDIGFCTQQFPLEGEYLGYKENSIGICDKYGMHIDGQLKKFGNFFFEYFEVGDVIGIGIIHSSANTPIKCFGTWNGQLLGKFELPNNYASIKLYPAVSLREISVSIRAKFWPGRMTF